MGMIRSTVDTRISCGLEPYPLLNEHEEWDVGYIEGHWSAGCHTSGKQTDLF